MEKYVIRANEKFLFDSFERPLVSALLGPRRVGKTTLLEYFINLHSDRKCVRLNMDVLNDFLPRCSDRCVLLHGATFV